MKWTILRCLSNTPRPMIFFSVTEDMPPTVGWLPGVQPYRVAANASSPAILGQLKRV